MLWRHRGPPTLPCREASARLQAVVQGVVDDAQGLPCLVSCATALADALQACDDGAGDGPTVPCPKPAGRPAPPADEQAPSPGGGRPLLRLVIWFHHIKSLTKRKTIVTAARDLGVSGQVVVPCVCRVCAVSMPPLALPM